jgi:hypothetical protein
MTTIIDHTDEYLVPCFTLASTPPSSIYEFSKQFSRDFLCCHKIFSDLHLLLEHYEEDHAESESEMSWTGKRKAQKEEMQCKKGRFDDWYLEALRAAATLEDQEEPQTVSPRELFCYPVICSSSEPEEYKPSETPHISIGVASLNSSGQVVQYGHVGRPPLVNENGVVEKRYRCGVAGCDKTYKNLNGLKYHNEFGHCRPGEQPRRPCSARRVRVEGDDSRRYRCDVGGCGKAYKNLGGLKYHLERAHSESAPVRRRQPQAQTLEFQRRVLERAEALAVQAGVDLATVELPVKKGTRKAMTAAAAAAIMQARIPQLCLE